MTVFLPELITGAAERDGDKAAFRCGDAELSYATLAERAGQLANALRADGVRPGDLVGIFMGKAIENPVAVFGVMAAGAAYVPIDPAAPVARVEQIAVSCRLRHLIIDDERLTKAAELQAALGTRCFVYGVSDELAAGTLGGQDLVARGWAEIATNAATPPIAGRAATDLAYLIFTSGSTGTPKGIVHTHGSGSAYASMAADLYGLTADDRLSNYPPLHFDQSTFDFFSGPLAGATTVIIDKTHQMVPASLSQLIEDERLTVWYSVPLALVQLLLYGVLEERDHRSLRWVIYGGEPFPLKHLQALMQRWPNARFSNCYGPAETNQCTYHHLEPLTDAAVAADAGVPIGVACPGMETLVVDDADHRVEPGQAGELLVHSPTTMAGYWQPDGLDGSSFLDRDDPDGQAGPRRYYRTGDLVRVDDDGLLHFLGRRDRQVKVRGTRVELDEVEAVLSTSDAVQEAAVIAIEAEEGSEDGPTIVAYVSTVDGADADETALKRHAAARLPRAAVPATVIVVDGFQRTTSGKIDYLALGRERASS